MRSYNRALVEDFVERLAASDKGAVLRFLHYVYDKSVGGSQDGQAFVDMVSFIAEFQQLSSWERANIMYGLVAWAAERVNEMAKKYAAEARKEDATLGTPDPSPKRSSQRSPRSIRPRTAEMVRVSKGGGRADEEEGDV